MCANLSCSCVLFFTFVNNYTRLCASALLWNKFEPLYVFFIDMTGKGITAANSFCNTQLLDTFFSTLGWRFSTFSCGIRNKAENCRNGLFFKKALTFTTNSAWINESVTMSLHFTNIWATTPSISNWNVFQL